ncbi:methyl-accepting chemotaxis protein [Ancylobacter lacus]|uniref:methyl-accepting chemotaxis protein n=1 Tax=Ancylobacter lacus TaxID=2579970 RepID=UPI001BCD4767|nr:HAMP domain-containing protein [Ancylobacter lacus]
MKYANLSMSWKVVSLLIALGLTSLGGAYYSATVMSEIDAEYSALIDGPQKATVRIARAARAAVTFEAQMLYGLIQSDPVLIAKATDAQKDAVARFEKLADEAKTLVPDRATAIDAIKAQMATVVAENCAKLAEIAQQPLTLELINAASQEAREHCVPALDAVIAATVSFNDAVIDEAAEISDGLTATTNNVRMVSISSIAVATLVVTLIGLFLVRRGIVAPIQNLMGVMKGLGEGKLDDVVAGTDRRDEIGAMAKGLEVLRGQLQAGRAAREEQQRREAVERATVERRANLARDFVNRMKDLATSFSQSSREVAEAARNLSASAEQTSQQALNVSASAEEAANNVQTVAAASEELAASVREISGQVGHSANVADRAFREAEASNQRIAELSSAATDIGDVINLIKGIADQTNLLALNATIEAARAGEAGKGFAVVASEVKELAAQTAKATSDISDKVSEIQSATRGTVSSMAEIIRVVTNIKEISASISGAVEEQGAATGEIAQNCQQASTGTQNVTDNITGVSKAAEVTGAASTQLLSLSQGLSTQASDLRGMVENFVKELNAA